MPMCRDDAGAKQKFKKAKPEDIAAYYGREVKHKRSDPVKELNELQEQKAGEQE